MSNFKNHIVIILCLLIVNTLSFKILKKYGKLEDTNGTVIFESKDFSSGNEMYFKVTINKECKKDLKYKYYSESEGISSTTTDYQVSYQSSDTTTKQNIVTKSVVYYIIEKKFSEYKSTNGNYLLLNIDCNGGQIDFENTEKDKSKKSYTLLIVLIIIGAVIIGVSLGICWGCIKGKASLQ